jgi:hypothetical protein
VGARASLARTVALAGGVLLAMLVVTGLASAAPSTGGDDRGVALGVDTLPSPSPEILQTAPPLPSPIAHPGDASTNTCVECHEKISSGQKVITDAWRESVHGKEGIGCADCHGGDPRSDSIGTAMSKTAGFVGAPGRSETVGLCGSCHSDPDRMRKFGLATDQYAKYYTSVHGQQLLVAKDTRVAICIDCHGSHGIKKASDPTADVYPLNVPKLCSSCHSDAQKMQPYGIPTNQYEIYSKSVHGVALLKNQDVRAPSCASCHGSHSAKPPRASEVVDVCGKCHTATQELYQQSRHSEVQAVGPKCWTCHGTHDVSEPSEQLFLHQGADPDYKCETCHDPTTKKLKLDFDRFTNADDRRCDTCHHSNSDIYAQVQAIAGALGSATKAYDLAEAKIGEAAAIGMIVSDADVAAQEAKTELIKARASVHTTKLTTISDLSGAATKKAADAQAVADRKLDESLFRREAMVVIIGIILVNVLLLIALRRVLHRRPPDPGVL